MERGRDARDESSDSQILPFALVTTELEVVVELLALLPDGAFAVALLVLEGLVVEVRERLRGRGGGQGGRREVVSVRGRGRRE